jgi:hypothetical protein
MPVGPRVSKEEFMHALGLNPQDPHHEQYYRAMRVSIPAEYLTLTFFLTFLSLSLSRTNTPYIFQEPSNPTPG